MSQSTNELLKIHYKLGHMYFAKIQFMSVMGWLEPKLAKWGIPKCATMEDKTDYQQFIKDEQTRRSGLYHPINSNHSNANRTSIKDWSNQAKWSLSTN